MIKKEVWKKENNQVFTKAGKTAVVLKESLGNFSNLVVTDQGKIKDLLEKSGLTYPAKVQELIQSPNVAVIKVIEQGWSVNGNYYDDSSLKELVGYIKQQGPIQFENHIEEGTKLDRGLAEIVSYSKYVWFDESTHSVYAAVKFPKEKADTGWILNMIHEDPEMIGVSISAAVYVTEEYEKDGKTGDKIDGWAYFDSADYVIFPSAGGHGIEATVVTEKIKHAKESVSAKAKLSLKPKISVQEAVDKLELVQEQVTSFLSQYTDQQACKEIQAVTNALNSFLSDCWYFIYDEDLDPTAQLTSIKTAFQQASDIITGLELFKNPKMGLANDGDFDDQGNAMVQESSKKQPLSLKLKEGAFVMKLDELKEKHPEAYVALVAEATNQAKAVVEAEIGKKVTEAEGKVTKAQEDLKKEQDVVSGLKAKVDAFEVKEAIVAKKEKIATMIKEAELPKEVVTPTFLNSLLLAKDDAAIKEMIDDRKAVVSAAPGGTTILKEGDKKTQQTSDSKKKLEAIADDVWSEVTKK